MQNRKLLGHGVLFRLLFIAALTFAMVGGFATAGHAAKLSEPIQSTVARTVTADPSDGGPPAHEVYLA